MNYTKRMLRMARVDTALGAETVALGILRDILEKIEVPEQRRIVAVVEHAMDDYIGMIAFGQEDVDGRS